MTFFAKSFEMIKGQAAFLQLMHPSNEVVVENEQPLVSAMFDDQNDVNNSQMRKFSNLICPKVGYE